MVTLMIENENWCVIKLGRVTMFGSWRRRGKKHRNCSFKSGNEKDWQKQESLEEGFGNRCLILLRWVHSRSFTMKYWMGWQWMKLKQREQGSGCEGIHWVKADIFSFFHLLSLSFLATCHPDNFLLFSLFYSLHEQ